MNSNCTKCGAEQKGLPFYYLAYNADRFVFCSRVCLVEFVAPEVKKAIVPNQWIPTPEEEARMCQ